MSDTALAEVDRLVVHDERRVLLGEAQQDEPAVEVTFSLTQERLAALEVPLFPVDGEAQSGLERRVVGADVVSPLMSFAPGRTSPDSSL